MTEAAPIGLATRLSEYWFAPIPAVRLACLRIAVGLFGLLYFGLRSKHFLEVRGYSVNAFRPVGPVAFLESPLPAAWVFALHGITLLSALFFTVGFKYRWSGPVYALGSLWIASYRNSFGMIFHTDNLVVLHAVVLALSPAADSLSLDALGRGPKPNDDAETSGWPLRLMCLLAVITYFLAGVAKLRLAGFSWAMGDVLREHIAYDAVRKIELGSIHSPLGAWLVTLPWVFPPLATVTLAFELGAPLALFHRKIAVVWCWTAFGFHLGVLLLMAIVFAYPLCGVAFFPFLDVERFMGPPARRVFQRFAPQSG
jgi:hypothetical protein